MCRIRGEVPLLLCLCIFFARILSAASISDDGVWTRQDPKSIGVTGTRDIVPQAYGTFRINSEMLKGVLRQAPLEFSSDAKIRNVILSIPLPNGSFANYRIQESPIMGKKLASQFPEIKTYSGQGIDDPDSILRFGWTSGGFHAIGITSHDMFFISSYAQGDTEHYISYWKKDAPHLQTPLRCLAPHAESESRSISPLAPMQSGATLRIYTAAIAATGEYTAYFGGTKSGALNNGIVPAINQLNAILEREFAIRLVLTDEEMKIIYTDPATDPYSGTVLDMATQNQPNLDAQIGSADYDIGHVFHGTGGSGVAYLSVVCSGIKAQGCSAFSTPNGVTWIVDLVAHEVGHQFSADHSFNGTTSSCGGGNRNASTAWEPGSGSTIMSYSGSCGAENVQNFSDPYYHVGNFDEILSFSSATACDDEIATGNHPPVVNAGPDYTIPKSTPFVLTASASDADGDPLTYDWEEWDVGNASPPNTDDGTRPIFRSFAPTSSPSRTFPKLSDVLNNVSTFGESLPTTDRTMKFRVTVRDNRAGGGGIANDMTLITVENGAGPFQVTSPNTAVTWNGGNQQTVTWNVAGTDAAPINTANVNILLSTDGGLTFPTILSSSTPNDGSESITVPAVTTTTARVKIEAVGNVFFDVSNTNFTITTTGCTPITLAPASLPTGSEGAAYNQTITASGGVSPYTFAVTLGALPPNLALSSDGSITGSPSTAGDFDFTITATDDNNCTGTRAYSVNVASDTCLFCDDFQDGVLSTSWTYSQPVWSETGGHLAGNSAKKVTAIATPAFDGCMNCTVDTQMKDSGGIGARLWLLAWYADKKNDLELLMKEESDVWVLKQKVNGRIVAKSKAKLPIDPGVSYLVRIAFDGAQFQVYINGTLAITLPKASGSSPMGTVGYQLKGTTAALEEIQVK